MSESLDARLRFDADGNIVADTTRGIVLIVRRAQRANVYANDSHGTDAGKSDRDAGVPAVGRGAAGAGGNADAGA